jgi:hypothetical protein
MLITNEKFEFETKVYTFTAFRKNRQFLVTVQRGLIDFVSVPFAYLEPFTFANFRNDSSLSYEHNVSCVVSFYTYIFFTSFYVHVASYRI